MKKISKTIKKSFTLLELLVSMTVFTVLMMALMQFLGSAQKLWVGTDQKNEMFENARMALDFMSRDIQSIFYEYDKTPFWSDVTNSRLCLATTTETLPTGCYSRIVGTEYFIGTSAATDSPPNCQQLYIYRFGDNNTTNWPKLYINSGSAQTNVEAAYGTTLPAVASSIAVIPYVVELKFTCYNKMFTEINASPGGYEFPYAINIDLTVLDKNSYIKWTAVDPTHSTANSAYEIVINNKRTFSRMVIIGDR